MEESGIYKQRRFENYMPSDLCYQFNQSTKETAIIYIMHLSHDQSGWEMVSKLTKNSRAQKWDAYA